MVLGVFSVYDKKSETFSQPMICDSHPDNKPEVSIRMFASMFKNGSMLYDFPEDYDLIYIGTFNDLTGEMNNDIEYGEDDTPIAIIDGVTAKDMMERKNHV